MSTFILPLHYAVIKSVKKKSLLEERLKTIKSDSPDIQLFLGDASNELKKLPTSSVDCVLTDPPYCIGHHRNWDKTRWDKDISQVNASDLLEPVLQELTRICKPDAHLYIFSSWKRQSEFSNIILKYFDILSVIIWDKGNKNPNPTDFNYYYANVHDIIFFCGQQGEKHRALSSSRSDDVIHINNIVGGAHGCEKPVALLESLIKNSTNQAEMICDPFMGSGSTGVAAFKNGRKFVGIEIEKQWFDLATDRINQAGIQELLD